MQKYGRRVRVSLLSAVFFNIQKKGTGENPDTFPGAEGETRRVFYPSCSLCEQFILCPFLLRKKMDEEFESPTLFALYRKKVPGKIPIPFLAQKERLDGLSTRRVRFANSLFYVPFCSAKRWTESSSLLPFLHYTEKRYRGKSRYLSRAEGETRRVFNPSCSLCEQFILCPFLLCKKTDEEFESLQTNSYIQKEKAQRKNPCAFSGAEGETRRVFNPSCSLCEQFILCPAPQKDGRRVRVSLPFLHYTEKRYRGKSRYLFWRRRRDSNSRAGYPTYALSRGASSPT